MTSRSEPRLLLLKIGGSLITRRETYCTFDSDRVTAYANELRRIWQRVQGRLVLVLGGGSFGHDTVERFSLQRPLAEQAGVGTNALTVNMMTLKLAVARQLNDVGVPAYPFQTSSFISTEGGAIGAVLLEPIFVALKAGLLPVLSGDLVFDTALGHVVFSSDRVPEAFLHRADIERIVVLTDVRGVLRRADGALIRTIDDENSEAALADAGPSAKQRDVTGGMRDKLRSLLSAAEAGVPSTIADGRRAWEGLNALFDPEADGTHVRALKRRVVRGSDARP